MANTTSTRAQRDSSHDADDDDDDGANHQRQAVARQTVRVIPAKGAPRPATTGAASVFAAARAARPVRERTPLNPDAVIVRTDVPIPAAAYNRKRESPYAALWARMPVGGSVVLTKGQAAAFRKWAETAKLRGQLVGRTFDDGMVGLWRVAPVDAPQAEPAQSVPVGLR